MTSVHRYALNSIFFLFCYFFILMPWIVSMCLLIAFLSSHTDKKVILFIYFSYWLITELQLLQWLLQYFIVDSLLPLVKSSCNTHAMRNQNNYSSTSSLTQSTNADFFQSANCFKTKLHSYYLFWRKICSHVHSFS